MQVTLVTKGTQLQKRQLPVPSLCSTVPQYHMPRESIASSLSPGCTASNCCGHAALAAAASCASCLIAPHSIHAHITKCTTAATQSVLADAVSDSKGKTECFGRTLASAMLQWVCKVTVLEHALRMLYCQTTMNSKKTKNCKM
eukprot:21073-Heterococcus_DN1.PRE.2